MSPKSDSKKRRDATTPTDAAPNPPQANESRHHPLRPGTDPKSPAEPKGQRPATPPAEQWREHEHQAPAADLQAKQLLQETGSPELAKHAVDQAQAQADMPTPPPTEADQDAAARQFGYDSFAALIKDSVAFPVERGDGLMVCELKDGRWIRFDRGSWPQHEIFRSRDEAMRPIAST
jgi:hypothetical protein